MTSQVHHGRACLTTTVGTWADWQIGKALRGAGKRGAVNPPSAWSR